MSPLGSQSPAIEDHGRHWIIRRKPGRTSGQRDEALKILAEQKRLAKQRYIGSYNFAIIYTGLGYKDRAFEYLNKAHDEGRILVQVPSRPLFDSLRSDPRYTELLRRIGRTP